MKFPGAITKINVLLKNRNITRKSFSPARKMLCFDMNSWHDTAVCRQFIMCDISLTFVGTPASELRRNIKYPIRSTGWGKYGGCVRASSWKLLTSSSFLPQPFTAPSN